MDCFRTKTLWVILPYFNFCGFKTRKELFINFVNEILKIKNIKIVIVEAMGPAPLGKLRVHSHIRLKAHNRIWIKENLINKGVEALPKDWKYMAWIDADIAFMNKNWVADTIHELKKYDLVQMWQSAVNLGPVGETLKIDTSFAFKAHSIEKKAPGAKYDDWHPGYAWACTRRFYNRIGALIDWAILGSADRHMAMAMIGQVLKSAPGNIHTHYKAMLEEFQDRVKGLTIGYTPGTVIHYWHGSLENRRYKQRWEILTENSFDPFLDIGTTGDGVIELTKRGQRLEQLINGYFLGRQEDS